MSRLGCYVNLFFNILDLVAHERRRVFHNLQLGLRGSAENILLQALPVSTVLPLLFLMCTPVDFLPCCCCWKHQARNISSRLDVFTERPSMEKAERAPQLSKNGKAVQDSLRLKARHNQLKFKEPYETCAPNCYWGPFSRCHSSGSNS